MKNETKNIYSCKSHIDAEEYAKLAKYFPQIYWLYASCGTFLVLLLMAFIRLVFNNLIITIIFGVVFEILILIIVRLGLEKLIRLHLKHFRPKRKYKDEYTIEFSDDGFKKIDDIYTYNFKYDDIRKCIETGTNFYFEIIKPKVILIIQKNECDLELIEFIRKKTKKPLNQAIKKETNYKNINILMHILIVISLFSFLLGRIICSVITNYYSFEELPLTTSTLSSVIGLIIPFIITIICIICNIKGYDCKKYIIINSCITLFFAIMIGGSIATVILINNTGGYEKTISEYQDIINLDLPNEGYIRYDSGYYKKDNQKSTYEVNYNVTIIDYSKTDTSKLLLSLKENEDWIISSKIDKQLIDYLIPNTKLNDESYSLFYNATTKEYNKVPSGDETQEIYFIKYNTKIKKLVIYEYLYVKGLNN